MVSPVTLHAHEELLEPIEDMQSFFMQMTAKEEKNIPKVRSPQSGVSVVNEMNELES